MKMYELEFQKHFGVAISSYREILGAYYYVKTLFPESYSDFLGTNIIKIKY